MIALPFFVNAWLARRRMPEWLLLRPAADGRWQWLHWRATGQGGQGDWPPPAHCLTLDIALVLPATACSHFDVPAPPGLKPFEWPQLLEEYLLQPPRTLQVSCLGKLHKRLQLLVVQREQLQQWLSNCEAQGARITRVWAEPQLLAEGVQAWEREADHVLKLGAGDERRRWLVWPKALGDLPTGTGLGPVESGAWPAVTVDLNTLPSVFALGRPAMRRSLPLSRGHWRLAALCLGLALTWGALGGWQNWQSSALARAQVMAVTGPAATAQQAGRLLQRMQREQADARIRQQQIGALEKAIDTWLEGEPQWQLSSSDYNGKRWQISLAGAGSIPPAMQWQALAEDAGARLQTARREAGLELSFEWEAP